jgi:hypothetical protein
MGLSPVQRSPSVCINKFKKPQKGTYVLVTNHRKWNRKEQSRSHPKFYILVSRQKHFKSKWLCLDMNQVRKGRKLRRYLPIGTSRLRSTYRAGRAATAAKVACCLARSLLGYQSDRPWPSTSGVHTHKIWIKVFKPIFLSQTFLQTGNLSKFCTTES